MTKQICIADLLNFDPAEYINTEEDVVAYLSAIEEENDPVLFAAALNDINRSRCNNS